MRQRLSSASTVITIPHARNRLARGFTMVELMVTIAIVAIIAAIAIPSINSNSPASEANGLLGMIQLARSAAVKQGQNVLVCPSSNPTAAAPVCNTGSTWSTGWIVLAPVSGLCTATGGATGDLVLQTQQAFTSKDTAVFSTTGSNKAFCFTRLGFAFTAYTGLVQFDSSPVNLARRRCTAVSGVGHAQVLTHGQSDALGVACP
jgi:type IV fimbrial biogenesis protein FimT